MPRRKSRFNDLEKQFRESGGVAAPGSKLAGYIDFKKGLNKIEVKNKVPAADRKRYAFALLPFGLRTRTDAVITDRYQAPITQYSNNGRRLLQLSDAQCGYENMAAGVQKGRNYYPAVIRPVILNTAPTDGNLSPISGVTRKEYNRAFIGKSFGIPFGRTITGVDGASIVSVGEEEVKQALATAIKAVPAANVKAISYLPEEFKSPEQELASPTAAV